MGERGTRQYHFLLVFSLVFVFVFVSAISPGVSGGPPLRPPSQWTLSQPATLPEIEAELKRHAGETLTYVGYGGAIQAAARKAFLEPLKERFGINFLEDTNPTAAKVRAMVQAKNVTWDVVGFGLFETWIAGRQGLLEVLDHRVVDQRHHIERTKSPWTGGGDNILWGTVLAYREGVKKPRSWADFWDFQNFPGKRGYGDYFTGHIEMPLFGAGLSPKDVRFPLTRDRQETIFAKLEELASKLDVYWSSGSTPPELLLKGELDYTSAWHTRIYDAQKQGARLNICWECGWVAGSGGYSIPRGSPHKALAQLFIAWTSFPEIAVQYARLAHVTPAYQDNAASRIVAMLRQMGADEEFINSLPAAPGNRSFMLVADEKWEAANYDRLNERYQSIFQKRKK